MRRWLTLRTAGHASATVAAVALLGFLLSGAITAVRTTGGPSWLLGGLALAAALGAFIFFALSGALAEPGSPSLAPISAFTSAGIVLLSWAPDLLIPSRLGRMQLALIAAGLVAVAAPRHIGRITEGSRIWSTRVSRPLVEKLRPWIGRMRTRLRRIDSTESAPVPGLRGVWVRNRTDIVLAGVLVMLGVAALLFFLREPLISDDVTYFEAGRAIRAGRFGGASANLHRLGFIFSIVGAQLVFGDTSIAYYAVPFAFNIGLIVAVYFLGRLFFPRLVAFAGAVLLLAQPTFLEEATLLLPDWPGMFWFALGLTLTIVCLRAGGLSIRWRYALAVTAAFSLFFSVWIKEGIAPLLLVVPLVLWVVELHPRWQRILMIHLVSFGGFLVVELGVNVFFFGDPLSRIRAILGGHVAGARGWPSGGLVSDSLTWWDLGTRYLDRLIELGQRPLLIAFVLMAVVAVVRRSKGLILFGSLALFGAAFVSLAVVSLEPLSPLLRTKSRYFSLALVFIPMFIVAGLWVAYRTLRDPDRSTATRLTTLPLMIAAVWMVIPGFGSGLATAADHPRLVRNGSDALGDIRDVVLAIDRSDQLRLNDLYLDFRTGNGVRMYLASEFTQSMKYMDYDSVGSEFTLRTTDRFEPGDVVMLNYTRIEYNERRYYGNPLPVWVQEPPTYFLQLAESGLPRVRVYYVLDEALVAEQKTDVTEYLHAYPFEEGDVDSLTRSEQESSVRFDMEGAGDVRVVLGGGTYNRKPTDEPLQLRPGDDVIIVEVTVIEAGTVEIRDPRLWLFDGAGDAVFSTPLRSVSGRDGGTVLTGSTVIDSSSDFVAFRVAFRVFGDGYLDVTARASVLDIGFDQIDLE